MPRAYDATLPPSQTTVKWLPTVVICEPQVESSNPTGVVVRLPCSLALEHYQSRTLTRCAPEPALQFPGSCAAQFVRSLTRIVRSVRTHVSPIRNAFSYEGSRKWSLSRRRNDDGYSQHDASVLVATTPIGASVTARAGETTVWNGHDQRAGSAGQGPRSFAAPPSRTRF